MPWTRQPWGGYHASQFRTSSKGKLLTVPRAESHLTDSDFGTPIQFGTPNQGNFFSLLLGLTGLTFQIGIVDQHVSNEGNNLEQYVLPDHYWIFVVLQYFLQN